MTRVALAALALTLIAALTLGQSDDLVATAELRCGTIAAILLDHGEKPLFRDGSLVNQSYDEPWRSVYDIIGPLATAYGCPPVVRERRDVHASIELQQPPEANPDANITFPPPVYVVRHRVVIRGTVTVPNLRSFFVEFRPLTPDGAAQPGDDEESMWFPATLPRIEPVRNDVLGTWLTTLIRDGLYELRLRINAGNGPPLLVYLSPIRVESMPSFATGDRAETPATVAVPSDLDEPLVFTSEEYGLSTVVGPVAIPKGLNLVKWRNTSDTGEGAMSIHVYALSPCFEFHETGSDEVQLFARNNRGAETTEVLKVVEDGCQILIDVTSSIRLEAWEIEIYGVETK